MDPSPLPTKSSLTYNRPKLARGHLFALQVLYQQLLPAIQMANKSTDLATVGNTLEYLYFNFNNPFLSKMKNRQDIFDTISFNEIVDLKNAGSDNWGVTKSFLPYGNPYMDTKFGDGGVFAYNFNPSSRNPGPHSLNE